MKNLLSLKKPALTVLAVSILLSFPALAADKVLLLINGSLGDKSFFDSAAHGMEMIKKKYGDQVETRVLEIGADATKWEPALLDASEQDWNLIIAGTYFISETLADVAQQYPDKKYILFDASVPYQEGGYDNVYSIQYKQNEGAWLAGVLGAELLKSGKIPAATGTHLGFLGGMDIPVINDFLVGYIGGARSVTPDIKIAVSYTSSFVDAAKGKELGLAQYRSGVALGFTAASEAGLGQLAAAKETGKYVIGVDSDQETIFAKSDPAISKQVVSSVLKNVDVSLLQAYDKYKAGTLKFGSAEAMGLKEGAVELVENGNLKRIAGPEIIVSLEKNKQQIASGEINVPTAFGMPTTTLTELRNSVRP